MTKATKTVTLKANTFDISRVTVAWYAFSDSRDNFIKVGKEALASGMSPDALLSHIRSVHIHKCLGGSAADYAPAKVADILALPGFDTKNPDDKKRSASQQAAVDAAKVQVSRVRGALGLIAPGKASAPEANAAQIARRKAEAAEAAAKAVPVNASLAKAKFTSRAQAAEWLTSLHALLVDVQKANAKFVTGEEAAWIMAQPKASES